MIDLRCDRCLQPVAAHQKLGDLCADGERGGPFVLMASERARELLIGRARASSPRPHEGSLTNGEARSDA